MNDYIPKLEDIIKNPSFKKLFFGTDNSEDIIVVTGANIDDIIVTLKQYNINTIKVNFYQMSLISRFVLASLRDLKSEEAAKECINIIKTGKTDKYFGVKLILE